MAIEKLVGDRYLFTDPSIPGARSVEIYHPLDTKAWACCRSDGPGYPIRWGGEDLLTAFAAAADLITWDDWRGIRRTHGNQDREQEVGPA